jgi:phosphoribosylanthranilate isomerase
MSTPSVLVKICGLSTASSLDVAVDAGADMIGLVHFGKSPRHVPEDRLKALADRARGRAEVVLLTVDADDALLGRLIDAARPDLVQLHGRETPERAAAIRDRFAVRTIKALGIATADDVRAADAFDGAVDWLDERSRHAGGTGATPFLLSGGLGPTNVGEAVARVRPGGVDVSSGVERAPGEKDDALIRAFVAAVRAAGGGAATAPSIEERVR